MPTRLLTLAFLLALSLDIPAQDLPYDSGSTGADGPFAVDIANGFGPRRHFTAAYDSARAMIVLQGGVTYSQWPPTTTNTSFFRSVDVADTRLFDGSSWSTPAGAGNPPRGFLAAAAFDPINGHVVHYGGQNANGFLIAYTSLWDGNQWSNANAAQPGSLAYQAMCYDGGNQEVIMFGGFIGGAVPRDRNATWAWNGSAWTNKAPANSPPARFYHAMCYDAARGEIVLFGGYSDSLTGNRNDTWVFDGTTWIEKQPATVPPSRHAHAMGYDPVSQKVVMYGGWSNDEEQIHRETWTWDGTDWTKASDATRTLSGRSGHAMVTDTSANALYLLGGFDYFDGTRDDTWRWDDTNARWVQVGGSHYMFDMSTKPDGVWNFTSIAIPQGVTVDLVPDASSRPAVWLANDQVTIDGNLRADGQHGSLLKNHPTRRPRGGPGGFPGGLGGHREEIYGTVAGTPGGGPGGGAPGTVLNAPGSNATHQGTYGNPYLLPAVGGSGGGGAAAGSTANPDGGNGGAGGGVIVIASSRDVTINGTVSANGGRGGFNQNNNGPLGGHGSAGAVKIVADRLFGSGTIETRAGDGSTDNNRGGYVRLESYLRPFDIAGTVTTGERSNSAPVLNAPVISPATLVISQVDGANVAQPPSGSFFSPDVVFSQPGEITITVTANGVPDGTAVRLRITAADQVLHLPDAADPAVTLAGGTASFTATVPAGFGTIQAFATYEVQTNP